MEANTNQGDAEEGRVCLAPDRALKDPPVTCSIQDTLVPEDSPQRAHQSLPDGLTIKPSKIPDAGLGVFAEKDFQEGCRFGPYDGVEVDAETGSKSDYAWEVRAEDGEGAVLHCVDGQDEARSNWMRFVNCARQESEQNLKAYQEGTSIYYLAHKPIKRDTELLVFYGKEFSKKLDIKLPAVSDGNCLDAATKDGNVVKSRLTASSSSKQRAIKSARPPKAPAVPAQPMELDSGPTPDDNPMPKDKIKDSVKDGVKKVVKDDIKDSVKDVKDIARGDQNSAKDTIIDNVVKDVHDDSKDIVKDGVEGSADKADDVDVDRESEVKVVADGGEEPSLNRSDSSVPEPVVCTWYEDIQDWAEGFIDFGNHEGEGQKKAAADPGEKPQAAKTSDCHICSECGDQFDDDEELQQHVISEHQLGGRGASNMINRNTDEDIILLDAKGDNKSQDTDMGEIAIVSIKGGVISDTECEQLQSEDDMVLIDQRNMARRPVTDRGRGKTREIEDGMSQQAWRQSICNICRKACHSREALEEHQKTHTLFKCSTCLVSFLDQESLSQHEADHRERPYYCGTCGKTYKSHFSLKEHEYSHTGHKPFVCPYCPKGFMRNKKLKLHIKKNHQKIVKAIQKPPPEPYVLAEHSNLVSGAQGSTETVNDDDGSYGDYTCKVCSKKYPTRKGLERHSKIHLIWGSVGASSASSSPHGSDSNENSAAAGEMHTESTIGPRPFKCQLCESTFLEESHLQIHVDIHSMDGPWVCVECDRPLKQRAHLLEHMYTHWDYKPYICLYCPMDFKRTYEAEKHMSLHRNQERRKQALKDKPQSARLRIRGSNSPSQIPTTQMEDLTPVQDEAMETESQEPPTKITNHEANNEDESLFPLQPLLPISVSNDGKTRPYFCELCDRTFTAKSSLKEHLFLHYGKPYPCDFCERQFTRKAYLISHMTEVHPEADTSAIQESVLDAKYEAIINKALERFQSADPRRSSSTSLTSSERSLVSTTTEKLYTCKECGKGFQFSATLQKHMRAHIKLKPLLCDFCERRFVRQSYLDEHIRTQHPPGSRSKDPNKPFKCETCGLAFSKRSYLKDHRYRHKLKKPFPCTFCSKSFRRRCLLQIHISRHHSSDYLKMASSSGSQPMPVDSPKKPANTLTIKLPFQKKKKNPVNATSLKKDPLMCYECGTTFSSQANVRRHMRIHSGERPFQCKVCSWTFNRTESLRHHMKKKHPGVPFQGIPTESQIQYKRLAGGHVCQKCGGVFKSPFALQSHMKQHGKGSNANPFKCSHCDFSFLRHVDLTKHNRFVHGIVQNNDKFTLPPANVKKIKQEPGTSQRATPDKTPAELHVCHRCGSRFDSFWGLESHSRVHEKHSRFPRPYKCGECGAAFKGLPNHTRHMRVHTPEYTAETKRLLSEMPGRKAEVQGHDNEPPKTDHRKKGVAEIFADAERPYVCPKCGTGYKYRRNLSKHISRHTKSAERPFQCMVCGIYARTKLSISKHMTVHGLSATSSLASEPDKMNVCKRCGAAFNSNQKLLLHMASHTNPNPSQPVFSCKHCNAGFKTRGALIIHERSHDGLNYSFVKQEVSELEQSNEKEVVVIKGLECPVCLKTFTRRSGVSNHMKVHPDVQFIWESDLNAGFKDPNEKPHECPVCHVKFRMKSSLSNHMHTHQDKGQGYSAVETTGPVNQSDPPFAELRPYTCDQCHCTFKTKGSLNTHMKVHTHEDDGRTRNHVCTTCQCRFLSSTNLKKHQRIHTGEKAMPSTPVKDPATAYSALENAESIDIKTKRPFRCRLCGETFRAKHLLDEHIQIHSTSPRQALHSVKQREIMSPNGDAEGTSSGEFTRMVERPFPCPICGDRFKLRSTKYKHIRLHKQSEGKPHRCSYCRLGFYSLGNMTKHLKRVHESVKKITPTTPQRVIPAAMTPASMTPVTASPNSLKKRPFACKYCGDTFTMRCNMNRHRKRHETGDNLPFRCSHCGFGFKSTKERTKHIMRAHSIVPKGISTPSVIPVMVGGKKRYKCPLCGDSFSEPSGMYKHMRVHARSANKPYRCDQCGIGYDSECGLSRHKGRVDHVSRVEKNGSSSVQQQHVGPDVKPDIRTLQAAVQRANNRFKCKYCPAVYRDRSSVWRHERFHKLGTSQSRPFSCSVCGFASYTQTHLDKHMQMHAKKPVITSLHSAAHGRKKVAKNPDRCKRCGLCFKTRSLFLVHIKRCTSSSSFICQFCSLPFSNQIMLTKHLRQDHNAVQRDVIIMAGREIIRETGSEKKFCCDQCNARYKRPSELEKHLRRHALGLIPSQQQSISGSSMPNEEDRSTFSQDSLLQEEKNCDQQEASSSTEVQPSLDTIRQSPSQGRMPVHNRTNKSGKARPYVCPTCGFAFMTVIHLRKHTRLHKVAHTKPFVCKECTLGYTRLLDYHRHCNVVHPWKKASPDEIRCPRCKNKFGTKEMLVEHLEKQTCVFTDELPEETYPDPVADGDAPGMADLDGTEQPQRGSDSVSGDLKCPICNCGFRTSAHIESHMKVHDNWEDQPFKCHRCKLGYTTKQHITKHFNLNPYCLKVSEGTENGSVQTSQAIHNHPPPQHRYPAPRGSTNRQCPHCGKCFAKRSQLEFHIGLHTPSPDRPYVCDRCGIGYKTTVNYYKHMKWEETKESEGHTRLTAAIFMCRDCGFSVTKKALLNEHNLNGCPKKKTNPDTQAPRACPVCGNYFSSTSMLCIHLHGHVYDKLLRCSQCPLRFALPEDRDQHEIDHPDWNDMLLRLVSSEMNRKLNSNEGTQVVKMEPGIDDLSRDDSDFNTNITVVKPEPVDEPEYNYSLGAVESRSILEDYQALFPDDDDESPNPLPLNELRGSKKSSAPVSRLEKIVSNLAAQRPSEIQQRVESPQQPAQKQTSVKDPTQDMVAEEDLLPSEDTLTNQVLQVSTSVSPKGAAKKLQTQNKVESSEKAKASKPKLFRCRYCPSAFRLKGLCMAHERTVHRKIYSPGSNNVSKPLKDLSKVCVCDICNSVFEQHSSLSRHKLFKHGIQTKSKEPDLDLAQDTPETPSMNGIARSSYLNTNSGPIITNVTSQGRSTGYSPNPPSLLRQRLQAPPDNSYVLPNHSYHKDLSLSVPGGQSKSTLESLLTGTSRSSMSEQDLWTPGQDFRPYKCERCNFAFTQRHHLVRHIKRDSCAFHVLGRKAAAELKSGMEGGVKIKPPEKKHKCPVCPRAFWKRARLENHMQKSHEGPGLHQCQFCSMEFEQQSQCSSHEASCPAKPADMDGLDYDEMMYGEDDIAMGSDDELDQAQEEAFMTDQDVDQAQRGGDKDTDSNQPREGQDSTGIRIKQEPLD